MLLEISQLLIAESSPVSAVEEHDTPVSCEISGDRHLAAPNLGGGDGCEDLVVLEAHVAILRLVGCPQSLEGLLRLGTLGVVGVDGSVGHVGIRADHVARGHR